MFKNIFPIFLLFFFSNEAIAKQIEIMSDKLEILRVENISIFSGNVHAKENDLEIWSKKLIVTSSKDQKQIKELTIIGDQAIYDTINNILTVIGKVKVIQNENTILCDEIIVDLENSSSIMKSVSNKRVEALIITENKN